MKKISELIGSGFYGSRRAVRAGAAEILEAGGRGSGKSSYLSIELLLQLLKHPGCHALVVRKVGATLRTSVYTQIQWAMEALGISDRFQCTLSPMECRYLPTGQRILFFGMDDPGKLKSLKMPFGYIGLLWFEELDQMDPEEVRSVEQSVFRGGDFSLSLKSFNPPADPSHWVNRYFLEEKEGKFAHKSCYLELPEEWLGKRFLQDAEHLSRVNPTVYRHEYLGQCVGSGDRAFPNLRLESLDPADFPRTVSGVDWGWWPDPWAFNRVAYRDGKLYVLEEAGGTRLSNRDTAAMVRARVGAGELILADSAEPKSIADYRAAGLNCRPVRKGPGSVEYSVKWLQSLEAIVVDPVRCPRTAEEFAGYAYRDGILPDRDNHHIDAVRYAAEHWYRRPQGGQPMRA